MKLKKLNDVQQLVSISLCRKHIPGIYVSENEGAKFWLSVLTDLQQRGVKDILIACINNLGGLRRLLTALSQNRGTELHCTSDPKYD